MIATIRIAKPLPEWVQTDIEKFLHHIYAAKLLTFKVTSSANARPVQAYLPERVLFCRFMKSTGITTAKKYLFFKIEYFHKLMSCAILLCKIAGSRIMQAILGKRITEGIAAGTPDNALTHG